MATLPFQLLKAKNTKSSLTPFSLAPTPGPPAEKACGLRSQPRPDPAQPCLLTAARLDCFDHPLTGPLLCSRVPHSPFSPQRTGSPNTTWGSHSATSGGSPFAQSPSQSPHRGWQDPMTWSHDLSSPLSLIHSNHTALLTLGAFTLAAPNFQKLLPLGSLIICSLTSFRALLKGNLPIEILFVRHPR